MGPFGISDLIRCDGRAEINKTISPSDLLELSSRVMPVIPWFGDISTDTLAFNSGGYVGRIFRK